MLPSKSNKTMGYAVAWNNSYFMNYSYKKDLGHDSRYSKQLLVEIRFPFQNLPSSPVGASRNENLNLSGFNCIGRVNPEITTVKDRQWPVSP
ncbi:hypothetical protein J2W42_001552 [Rhizobium tibeticum]|uniref:Uncharacterized protein n=1 Tax=Rhizobium tibeticum TaxID=501024 RepID=A0A1H8G8Z4_9HYPH|nr:hypothetical protein [Rhizobium tibeticum]SEH59946.1 hypothetical protein RTCCBAU85039_1334 [Rhizobium tibeticum]SEN40230.1 hypothetical protein SAMN05216228_1004144 [Rhizobium tibeticum]